MKPSFLMQTCPRFANNLALKGIRVVAAGLDMDFRGKPFGPIPAMLSIAEYVTKVHAICVHCGKPGYPLV